MSSKEIEEELERTIQMKGFRHGIHEFICHTKGVEALKAHNEHSQKNYLKKGLLDKKTKELLYIVGLVATRGLVSHIHLHMHAACNAGSSAEEILEVLELQRSVFGSGNYMAGLEAWRSFFRPDIPSIDRVVALR